MVKGNEMSPLFHNATVMKIPMTGYDCGDISDLLEEIISKVDDYAEKFALRNIKIQFDNAEEFWVNEVVSLDSYPVDGEILSSDEFEKQSREIMSTSFGMVIITDPMYFNPQRFNRYKEYFDYEAWEYLMGVLFPEYQVN